MVRTEPSAAALALRDDPGYCEPALSCPSSAASPTACSPPLLPAIASCGGPAALSVSSSSSLSLPAVHTTKDKSPVPPTQHTHNNASASVLGLAHTQPYSTLTTSDNGRTGSDNSDSHHNLKDGTLESTAKTFQSGSVDTNTGHRTLAQEDEDHGAIGHSSDSTEKTPSCRATHSMQCLSTPSRQSMPLSQLAPSELPIPLCPALPDTNGDQRVPSPSLAQTRTAEKAKVDAMMHRASCADEPISSRVLHSSQALLQEPRSKACDGNLAARAVGCRRADTGQQQASAQTPTLKRIQFPSILRSLPSTRSQRGSLSSPCIPTLSTETQASPFLSPTTRQESRSAMDMNKEKDDTETTAVELGMVKGKDNEKDKEGPLHSRPLLAAKKSAKFLLTSAVGFGQHRHQTTEKCSSNGDRETGSGIRGTEATPISTLIIGSRTKRKKESTASTLAVEILSLIFRNLMDRKSVLNCSLVSTHWHGPARLELERIIQDMPFNGHGLVHAIRARFASDTFPFMSMTVFDRLVCNLSELYYLSNPETKEVFAPENAPDMLYHLFWTFLFIDQEFRNPRARPKVTCGYFVRLLQSEGGGYPKEYFDKKVLKNIYNDIRARPLLPAPHLIRALQEVDGVTHGTVAIHPTLPTPTPTPIPTGTEETTDNPPAPARRASNIHWTGSASGSASGAAGSSSSNIGMGLRQSSFHGLTSAMRLEEPFKRMRRWWRFVREDYDRQHTVEEALAEEQAQGGQGTNRESPPLQQEELSKQTMHLGNPIAGGSEGSLVAGQASSATVAGPAGVAMNSNSQSASNIPSSSTAQAYILSTPSGSGGKRSSGSEPQLHHSSSSPVLLHQGSMNTLPRTRAETSLGVTSSSRADEILCTCQQASPDKKDHLSGRGFSLRSRFGSKSDMSLSRRKTSSQVGNSNGNSSSGQGAAGTGKGRVCSHHGHNSPSNLNTGHSSTATLGANSGAKPTAAASMMSMMMGTGSLSHPVMNLGFTTVPHGWHPEGDGLDYTVRFPRAKKPSRLGDQHQILECSTILKEMDMDI